jgi:Glycosyltransferase family 87
MKHSLQTAFKSWIGLSLLVVASLVVIYVRNGMDGLDLFIQQWPLSDLVVTLASTTITWLLLGALLYMLSNEKINAGNVFFVVGFFLIMFLYLNILRERFRYGDYAYYIEAATALLNHQHLPDTYLYLPLWATLLQYIVPLGDQGVLLILWTMNIAVLGLFYALLVKTLEQYGYSNRLAVTITVLFIAVNTPLHRTLGYVQVNLLVMVLVMYSILTFPRNTFLSALALALAVHLKTSPAALVLAFLLERNWRWVAWFALTFIVIALIPVAIVGVTPYFDYVANIGILTHITDTNFHDTSFDSFFRFFDPFLGIGIETTRAIIYGAKAALALSTIYVMVQNIRKHTFVDEKTASSTLLNAIPSLFIVMTLASPIVWDHHGIFLALSFLLLIKCIESPALWMWFGFAYFLEFILPSFDFFPWSFGRLIAPMIVLWLMWRSTKENAPSSFSFFSNANHWLTALKI